MHRDDEVLFPQKEDRHPKIVRRREFSDLLVAANEVASGMGGKGANYKERERQKVADRHRNSGKIMQPHLGKHFTGARAQKEKREHLENEVPNKKYSEITHTF